MISTGGDHGKVYYMREFRNQLVRFLDELIEQFPQMPEFVIFRIFVKDQAPAADVIGRFIRDLLPFRDQVKQRNDNFFLEHSVMYMEKKGYKNGKKNADYFSQIWNGDQLDDEDRKIIWEWMDLFMEIAGKYHSQYGHIKDWEPEDVLGLVAKLEEEKKKMESLVT